HLKKCGIGKFGKSQSKEPERPLPPAGPVAVDPKGCVTIAIHAKPGSKQNAVTGTAGPGVGSEGLGVGIPSTPRSGKLSLNSQGYFSYW
uniref:Uncharacterized protein n=1 Tax=Suricata suricatta TaxID=37032 RepID=A0A673TCP3_SURSU